MAACPTIGQCNKYKYMHTRKDLTAMIYISFMSTNLPSQQYDKFAEKVAVAVIVYYKNKARSKVFSSYRKLATS